MSWITAPFRAVKALFRVTKTAAQQEPIFVSELLKAKRRQKCKSCEFMQDSAAGGYCDVCKCSISLKTMLTTERCPLTPPRWT